MPEGWRRCPHGTPVPSGERLSEWIARCPVCAAEEHLRLANRERLLASNGGDPLPSRYPVGQTADPLFTPGARPSVVGR